MSAASKSAAVPGIGRFLRRAGGIATDGGWGFYLWMTALTAIALVGANAWAMQVRDGLVRTNMSDHVCWGLYIANFNFCVGLAAGGVMMVIPAFLYRDDQMHDVVIVGEILAIAAILMSLLSVIVDLGRPDRFWHLIPGLGKFNWPMSILTWDVIVLNGYLLINLYIVGYIVYRRFNGREPNPKWYLPFVFLSIAWAIAIHVATAFLYCGLGGRPFWNTALLAPRFLASAFVSGPAFILLALRIIRTQTDFPLMPGPARTLVQVIRVAAAVNLLMLICELFTAFYSGGEHSSSVRYLFLGEGSKRALLPWTYSSIVLNVVGTVLLFMPATLERSWLRPVACVLCIAGIWIEKGLGMVVAGFIPSALHEFVEYTPSMTEWKITAGIWAIGLLVYTALLKVAVAVFLGSSDKSRPLDTEPDSIRAAGDVVACGAKTPNC